MKQPHIANIFVLMHLGWSSLVYFGTLNSNDHGWWPLFLLYVRWPAGIAFEAIARLISGIPESSAYTLNDHIAGAFYIFGGAAWVWFIVYLLGLVFFEESDRRPN